MKLRKLAFKSVLALAVSVPTASLVSTQEAEAAPRCAKMKVRYGDRGRCVKAVQGLLNYHKWSGKGKNIAVDGVYGQKTRSALIGYQRSLPLAADGVVGPKTWQWLCQRGMGGSTVPPVFQVLRAQAGC